MRPNEPRHWTWPTLDEAVHHIAMAAGTVLWAAAAWAFLSGPSRHAEAEQRVAVEVEAENEDACQRLGMPAGGARYTTGAVELSRVRHQHEDRASRRAAGLL